jgi:hypothetical protein
MMDIVMTDPDTLKAEFAGAAVNAGIDGWPCSIRWERLPAPHVRPRLPPGEAAVYAFVVSSAYGRAAPCSAGTVLKVGKAGPKSEARFRNMHYLTGSRENSTLAKSLLVRQRHFVIFEGNGGERCGHRVIMRGCVDAR